MYRDTQLLSPMTDNRRNCHNNADIIVITCHDTFVYDYVTIDYVIDVTVTVSQLKLETISLTRYDKHGTTWVHTCLVKATETGLCGLASRLLRDNPRHTSGQGGTRE